MFMLSLLLIVTGVLVRNVLTIHSRAVDVRQLGSILIASGIGVLVLKLAAVALGGDRKAGGTVAEDWADRPDAAHPAMPQRRTEPDGSISGSRRSDSRPASYGMLDWRNPFGWTNPMSPNNPYNVKKRDSSNHPYSPTNPTNVHKRHQRPLQQQQASHRHHRHR